MNRTIDVTYTGSDEPFVDRIYHSGLTFMPGQTRPVPLALAQRLLRHSDVFGEAAPGKAAPAKAPGMPDDTAQQLADAAAANARRQAAQDNHFDLLQQVERMDKAALRDFAKVNFRQELAPQWGVEKMRDRVRGMIDQFGAP